MIGNQNPRWMGLDAGRLGMAIAACALAGACFGGGGIDYETLAQENRSAAPYSFQYLGVAGTREDAVKLAEDMVDPEALEALADFDPETQVLVAFRVGTSGERGGESDISTPFALVTSEWRSGSIGQMTASMMTTTKTPLPIISSLWNVRTSLVRIPTVGLRSTAAKSSPTVVRPSGRAKLESLSAFRMCPRATRT